MFSGKDLKKEKELTLNLFQGPKQLKLEFSIMKQTSMTLVWNILGAETTSFDHNFYF